MPYYAYKNIKPVVAKSAFVDETAVVIGDVIIGENVYIGPNAVLRGDCARLVLMDGANLQDGCIMHAIPEYETVVEQDGHIGHGAILHGCRIKKNALIGMQAVIMDGAVVGENSFIGANSVLPAFKTIPDNVLAFGNPAKVQRDLTAQDIDWKNQGTDIYKQFAHEYLNGDMVKLSEPLREMDDNRPSLDIIYKTLAESKNT